MPPKKDQFGNIIDEYNEPRPSSLSDAPDSSHVGRETVGSRYSNMSDAPVEEEDEKQPELETITEEPELTDKPTEDESDTGNTDNTDKPDNPLKEKETPVFTTLEETVNFRIKEQEQENNYPELEDIEDQANELKAKETPGLSKEDIKAQAKARKALDSGIKTFNKALKDEITGESLDKFNTELTSILKLPDILVKDQFQQVFSRYYGEMLNSTLLRLAGQKANTVGTLSIIDATKQVDDLLKLQLSYVKTLNDKFRSIEFKELGGLAPSTVRDIQMACYFKIDEDIRDSKEKDDIDKFYSDNRDLENERSTKSFYSFVKDLNNSEHTNFSAFGIEKYFKNRWAECNAKTLEEKQTMFKKEFSEFCTEAFKNMAGKSNSKTDFKIQLENFNKFCDKLHDMCRENGYLDEKEPHMLYGGMLASTIKGIQKKALDMLPKTSEQLAKKNIEDLTGVTKDKTEAERRAKEKVLQSMGRKEKEKFNAVDKKHHNIQKLREYTAQHADDFNKFIEKIINEIPPVNANNGDTSKVKNAINVIKALESVNGARGRLWKMSNRSEYSKHSEAVNKILDAINSKGYNKEAIEHIKASKTDPAADEVTRHFMEQKKSIDNMAIENDRIITEKEKIISETKDNDDFDRERITVDEADVIQDIINPKEKSEPVKELDKNLEKTIDAKPA